MFSRTDVPPRILDRWWARTAKPWIISIVSFTPRKRLPTPAEMQKLRDKFAKPKRA